MEGREEAAQEWRLKRRVCEKTLNFALYKCNLLKH